MTAAKLLPFWRRAILVLAGVVPEKNVTQSVLILACVAFVFVDIRVPEDSTKATTTTNRTRRATTARPDRGPAPDAFTGATLLSEPIDLWVTVLPPSRPPGELLHNHRPRRDTRNVTCAPEHGKGTKALQYQGVSESGRCPW